MTDRPADRWWAATAALGALLLAGCVVEDAGTASAGSPAATATDDADASVAVAGERVGDDGAAQDDAAEDGSGGQGSDGSVTDAAPPGTDPHPPADALLGEVERVVDGDTVVVEVGGERERVRLLRIDTPELARDGEPAECLAQEAAAALDALLPPGEPVLLALDVERRDRFGRLLAHVWSRATWVNAQMLRDGYAQVVTFPPNTAFDTEVLAAQRQAREDEVGLWSPGACP